jgi:hypothetical protein
MPRIRSVHPDICNDDVLPEVSAYAERTWVRLWTHLDDKGRGTDNAKLWAGLLYPLHDDVTPERVERDLAELEARGLILRYEAEGRRWLCAKPESWAKYQKPQHPTPTKIPPPPDHLTSGSGGSRVDAHTGVEGSCVGKGGESEGRAGDAESVHSPLAEQAKKAAERAAKFELRAGEGNPAASTSVVEARSQAAHVNGASA